MKLEIDLKDIFVGEFEGDNGESAHIDINTAIREAVIDKIVRKVSYGVESSFKDHIDKIVTDSVKENVDEMLKKELATILDYEFKEVNSWGEVKGTWTIRNRIYKEIENQFTFKNSGYSSDRNFFSNAVIDTVKKKVDEFQKEFNKQVEAQYLQETLFKATLSLKEKLGIKGI